MNRSISKETELVILKLLTKKSPGQDGFIGEFHQTFKGKINIIFGKPFHKMKEEYFLTQSMSPIVP